MKKRLIRDGVFLMGAVDWNRRLFDSLIPLPEGTSYNAYLVEGSEKTALIDTADPELEHVLLAQLEEIAQRRGLQYKAELAMKVAAAPSAPAWQHRWEKAVDALGDFVVDELFESGVIDRAVRPHRGRQGRVDAAQVFHCFLR